jgi:HEAT repeat protein
MVVRSWVHSCVALLWFSAACSSNDPRARLQSADPQVRIVAAQELGSATDPIVALHLLEPVFRTDPVMWVRMEAAFSIGKLHLRDGTALLLAMAESRDDRTIRLAALTAIERNPDPIAIPRLIGLWRLERDKDDYVAHIGADHALRAIGKPAVDPLLTVALDAKNRAYVRTNALHVLERIPDPSVRDRLAPLVDDPTPGVSSATKDVLDALDHPPSAN